MTAPTSLERIAIRVGTSWTDTNGREWSVYEVLPFGRARVRSGMRFGEMRHRDIRKAIASQEDRQFAEVIARCKACEVKTLKALDDLPLIRGGFPEWMRS